VASELLNFLLTGGPVRRRIADHLHGMVWARRLWGGRSDAAEMNLLDGFGLANRIAIDVGAHAGNWAFNLSKRVGPTGAVIAYEALPHYGRSLSIAMQLLGVKNVQIRNVAVGDCSRTIGLRWRTDSRELLTGRTHIEHTGHESANIVQVPMVSLDRDLEFYGISPSEVAFVKIDVEGAELEVLRGASNLLSAVHPGIFLEAEPKWLGRFGHSVRDVFMEMSNHGYLPYLVHDAQITSTDINQYLAQYESGLGSNNVLFIHTSTKGWPPADWSRSDR